MLLAFSGLIFLYEFLSKNKNNATFYEVNGTK